MPAQWTGELIGNIHNAGLTIKEVAERAGLNSKYVSTLLNGDAPEGKAGKKLRDALVELQTERSKESA